MLCTNIKAEFADAEAGCIYNKIEQLLGATLEQPCFKMLFSKYGYPQTHGKWLFDLYTRRDRGHIFILRVCGLCYFITYFLRVHFIAKTSIASAIARVGRKTLRN